MKKFKLATFAILAVLLCVGFASCSDDDDDDVMDNDELVGLWGIESSLLDDSAFEYGKVVKFNSNGSGEYFPDYNNNSRLKKKFDYVYDDDTRMLVCTSTKSTFLTIDLVSANKLVFSYTSDGTLIRDCFNRLR